jgi:hypothetical protein
MDRLLTSTLAYMQAGYQSGLLLPELAPIRPKRVLEVNRGRDFA